MEKEEVGGQAPVAACVPWHASVVHDAIIKGVSVYLEMA